MIQLQRGSLISRWISKGVRVTPNRGTPPPFHSPVFGFAHRTDIHTPHLEISNRIPSPASAVKSASRKAEKNKLRSRCSAACRSLLGFTGPATPRDGGGSGRAPPRRWCGAWPPCPDSACPQHQIIAGVVHAEHAAGAVQMLHQQAGLPQHLGLGQQPEAAIPHPVIERGSPAPPSASAWPIYSGFMALKPPPSRWRGAPAAPGPQGR